MSDCRVFKKIYPDNSGSVTITYYRIGYPIIEKDYSLESQWKNEMEEDEEFFKFRKLNEYILSSLKEKEFDEMS